MFIQNLKRHVNVANEALSLALLFFPLPHFLSPELLLSLSKATLFWHFNMELFIKEAVVVSSLHIISLFLSTHLALHFAVCLPVFLSPLLNSCHLSPKTHSVLCFSVSVQLFITEAVWFRLSSVTQLLSSRWWEFTFTGLSALRDSAFKTHYPSSQLWGTNYTTTGIFYKLCRWSLPVIQ